VQAGTLTPLSAMPSAVSYSPGAQTYKGTVTITNTGLAPIKGPFQLLFTQLPSGVAVVNASGQIAGTYYIKTPPATLAPGQVLTVSVQFSNPSNVAITYTPVITQGAF